MFLSRSVFFLILFIATTNCRSQNETFTDTLLFEDVFSLNLDKDIKEQIQPLDTLIRIAYEFSPILKFWDNNTAAAEYNVKLAKRAWHQNISGFATNSYGSQNVLLSSVGQNLPGSQTTNGYAIGATVNVPIAIFTQTPLKIKIMRAELKMSQAKFEEAKLEVSRMVIAEYFRLIAAQRQLKLAAEDVQNTSLVANIADVQFQQGVIAPIEYGRIKTAQNAAKVTYELRIQEFATAYFQFEALLGVEMYQIKASSTP